MTYLDDYKVPGHDLTISSHLMIEDDSVAFVLGMVADHCGASAAAACAEEMRARRRQRSATIGTFLQAFSETNDVDAALAAAMSKRS